MLIIQCSNVERDTGSFQRVFDKILPLKDQNRKYLTLLLTAILATHVRYYITKDTYTKCINSQVNSELISCIHFETHVS